MREFIRHPASVPIQLDELDKDNQHSLNNLNNVSFGGLSCFCSEPVESGTTIRIRIECVDPDFQMSGKVVWCQPREGLYEVGIEFIASRDKMFLLRMVEQLCHIEHYRKEIMQKEGREMSSEQAAREWIVKYADSFPK